jgi:hypothetical protein
MPGAGCVFVIKKIPTVTNDFPGNDRYGWGHVFEEGQMCRSLTIIGFGRNAGTNGEEQ